MKTIKCKVIKYCSYKTKIDISSWTEEVAKNVFFVKKDSLAYNDSIYILRIIMLDF